LGKNPGCRGFNLYADMLDHAVRSLLVQAESVAADAFDARGA